MALRLPEKVVDNNAVAVLGNLPNLDVGIRVDLDYLHCLNP